MRALGKVGFVLVIIGFFLPVACDSSGFEIAQRGEGAESLLLWGLLISAAVGVIVGVMSLLNVSIPVVIDWLVLIVCSCCGLIPFFKNLDNLDYFQVGAYVILGGIIVSWVCQLVSLGKKQT